MFKNYFKTAFHFFQRSALYAIVNFSGLVVGATASALLFIYVWDELRHDTFHENLDSVYRITTHQQNGSVGVTTPGPLAPALLENYPQIAEAVRIGKWSGALKLDDHLFEENEIYFTDNSFFKVFNFELIVGKQEDVLKQPYEILLTEKTAAKFFGNDWAKASDVLGKIISLNGQEQFTVSGVVKNPPSYSSIQFDYLLSFKYVEGDRWNYQWGSHNFHTYLLLKQNAKPEILASEIKDYLKKYEFNEGLSLDLQALKNVYMQSFPGYDWGKHGNPQHVVIFIVIGILILAVACFNYINISTARIAKRAKEIGVRKINGARRIDIFIQFMGESAVVVFSSVCIARGVLDIALPFFNTVSGKNFSSNSFQVELTALFFCIAVVTTLVAGIYPALILSNLKPLNIVRGTALIASGKRFRSALITSQFFVSMILISAAIIIFRQLDFMQNKDIGFRKDALAYVKLGGSLKHDNEKFKEALRSLSYVEAATRSTSTLVNTDNGSYIEWPGKKQGEEVTISQLNVDSDFISTLEIKMLGGRQFVSTDSNSYILNESAVKAMGLTIQNALGTNVKFWGTEGTVVGIVKDFHFRPLHHPISPLIIRHNTRENFYQVLVRVNKNKINDFAMEAARIFKGHEAAFPFSYGFFQDEMESQYQNEKNIGKIILSFSGLSIVISLLGVFGMVSYTIEQRTREFSIRKILGSTYANFLFIIGNKLVWNFLVALLLAVPLGYWMMTRWLENFSYRISLSPWPFIESFGVIAGLTAIVLAFETAKQMKRNTVNSLKTQ